MNDKSDIRTPRLQTHPTPMMSARTCHVITCVLVTDVRTHSALWTLLALFLEIFQHLVLVTELSPILDFDTSTRRVSFVVAKPALYLCSSAKRELSIFVTFDDCSEKYEGSSIR